MGIDWTRKEVEVTVADYFAMLAAELSGVSYSKAAHRRALIEQLPGRSAQAVEFKHANVSAILIDIGFPFISGCKPRSNYQKLLCDVVVERLTSDLQLLSIAAADADRPIVVPEVEDILGVATTPPVPLPRDNVPMKVELPSLGSTLFINYLEREARNQSLGAAGQLYALSFERARLISLGKGTLADKIEHTSRCRGDGAGYDILSYEASGAQRLIEVKTTKYGRDTPFFVSRREIAVSRAEASRYHLYRLFGFNVNPRLFALAGSLSDTCSLSASTYLASVR